jgi:N utilization substance protein B
MYQKEITKAPLGEIIKNRINAGESEPPSDFSMRLIQGVISHQEEINNLIEGYADNWALERMPTLDRNIIRISLYEMLYENDIPFSVSINEAVELAKIYGTEDSGKFVNGVLGKIAFDLEKSKAKKSK